MSKVKVDTHELELGIKKINDEINQIIKEEVHTLYGELVDIGERVRVTGHFKKSFVAPKKHQWGWRIRNTALYSSILAYGRIGSRGSKKWSLGLQPCLNRTKRNILKRTKGIQV